MKKTTFLLFALILSATSAIFAQDDLTVFVQRDFTIKVEPNDAEVYLINSTGGAEKIGVGSRAVHAEKDVSYKFEFRKDGYQTIQRLYYRKKGGVDQDIVDLSRDEAYTQSEENSIANTNFNVSVNTNINATDAWKILTSIIQTYFDEIQTIDAATSYLRTNWVASLPFNKESNNYRRIIRTQVVVSSASSVPLKYNVKIKSEISKIDKDCASGGKLPAINKDECFEPFSRILRKYNDMINEIQRRMQ